MNLLVDILYRRITEEEWSHGEDGHLCMPIYRNLSVTYVEQRLKKFGIRVIAYHSQSFDELSYIIKLRVLEVSSLPYAIPKRCMKKYIPLPDDIINMICDYY